MTLVTEPFTGIELIQQNALLTLFDNINTRITEINEFMAGSDEEFAARLGRTYTPTVVEPIANTNFHTGHRPSLINAPISEYPNVSVWSVRVNPTPESELLDQLSIHRTLLYIELMVKSESSEEEVNRRLLRTVEAAIVCYEDNPTLGGLVAGIDSDPTVNISDVFTRKERSAYGPHWFWQGARIEFTVRKESASPVAQGSGIFSTESSGSSGIDYSQYIDQG